jgi:hypothetical protein
LNVKEKCKINAAIFCSKFNNSMREFYRYSIFFLLLLVAKWLPAQNITGTWEGVMGNEYLMVSVEQKGNELCGYTYDHQLRNKADHCIAAYVGRYDSQRDVWYISGRSFIENSGTHVFMRIIMWQDRDLGRNSLKAMVYTGSGMGAFLGLGGEEIVLTKISGQPKKLPGGKPDCFPKPVKPVTPPAPVERPKAVPPKVIPAVPESTKTKSAPLKPVLPKPVPVKPAPAKPQVKLIPKTDSVIKVNPTPAPTVVKPRTDAELLRKMNERRQQQQSRLEVNVKRINLKVYDNGVVDNDTVSIFYNGKLLLSHKRLSEQAIELNIDLDENTTEHTITMFAENLGGIPPNTAVVIVTAGDKRYELRSKASLEENAVLVFDYRPRE